jgi:hypothetical protein
MALPRYNAGRYELLPRIAEITRISRPKITG